VESTVSTSASIARVSLPATELGGRHRHDVYKGGRGRPVVWSRGSSSRMVSSGLTAAEASWYAEGLRSNDGLTMQRSQASMLHATAIIGKTNRALAGGVESRQGSERVI
jgi:hypothetical protein